MEKISSYTAEWRESDGKLHSSTVYKGWGVTLSKAREVIREGRATKVMIHGYRQGHCIFENEITKDALHPMLTGR